MSNDTLFWVNRIIESGTASPEELAKGYNSWNFRGHPENQRGAVEESLDSLGILQPVLFNRTTGHVIDGHLRIELAIIKGQSLMPVNYVELTEDEEALALQVLDATTEMAEPIADKLAVLMERTRSLVADKPGLVAMLEGLRQRVVNGNGKHKISQGGRLYNAGEGHSIEPFKLAYRIEAAWRARGNKAIDLFSGKGQLAEWYKRRFGTVITIDKNELEVDYQMTANDFIDLELQNHLDFDFVDFDDEGSPAREIQQFFRAISGKKQESFILTLTDSNGLNLKMRGKFAPSNYLLPGNIRHATREDYDNFEELVTGFIRRCAQEAKFTQTMLSSYRGREGNVIYQTWLIEP